MQEPEERSDVSWSDAEEKYDVEDDLPLDEARKLLRPSKRWIDNTVSWKVKVLSGTENGSGHRRTAPLQATTMRWTAGII